MHLRHFTCIALLASTLTWHCLAENVPATAVLPGDATLAIDVPDCTALKKTLADSDFGKLWAEPDVQQFIKPMWDDFLARYSDAQKGNPALPDLADLNKVINGEIALTLTVDPQNPDKEPLLCAALQIGDAQTATKLLTPLLQGKALAEGALIPLPQLESSSRPFELVFEKGFLFLTNDAAQLKKISTRLADPAQRADALAGAQGWQAAQKLLGAPGQAVVFCSVPNLLHFIMIKEGAPDADRLKALLVATGVGGITGVAVQLGSRGQLLTLDTALTLNGPPESLLATALSPKPLPLAALKIVPVQSSYCYAGRCDSLTLLKSIRDLPLGQDELANMDAALLAARELLGVDLEKDLFTALGDVWLAYDTGGTDFFGLVPSMALAVELKDPALAQRSLDKLVAAGKEHLAQNGPPGFGPQAELHQVTLNGTSVHYLSYDPVPISPSLAIAGNHLFLTLTVAGMRRALAQLTAGGDITGSAGFKPALEHAMGKPLPAQEVPAPFSYACPVSNTAIFSTGADLAHVFLGALSLQARIMAQFGGQPQDQRALWKAVDKLDFALFPPTEVLLKHMHPAASVWMNEPGGLILRNDITVPNTWLSPGQTGLASLPVLAAIAIPSTLRSRVTTNEAAAVAACKAYAEAQEMYHRTNWNNDGVLQYAQCLHGHRPAPAIGVVETPEPTPADLEKLNPLLAKLASDQFADRQQAAAAIEKMGPKMVKPLEKQAKESTDAEVRAACAILVAKLKATIKGPGLDTQFGLYSSDKAEGDIALIDRAFANAEGNPSDHPMPKAGYCFKVLAAQGPAATGGKKSYLTNGRMTLGYALVAYPARYDSTGRNTFLINGAGVIYQKDLGKNTAKIVEEMTEFNPDQTWIPAQ